MTVLLAAFGFALVLEGLLPIIAPGRWREMVRTLSEMQDGQIRFVGMGCVIVGLLLAWIA